MRVTVELKLEYKITLYLDCFTKNKKEINLMLMRITVELKYKCNEMQQT